VKGGSGGASNDTSRVGFEECLEAVERALEATLLAVALDVKMKSARKGLKGVSKSIHGCILFGGRFAFLGDGFHELVKGEDLVAGEGAKEDREGIGEIDFHDLGQGFRFRGVVLDVEDRGQMQRCGANHGVVDAKAVAHADSILATGGLDGQVAAVDAVIRGRQIDFAAIGNGLDLVFRGAIEGQEALFP
jgi:hypothetical protein